MNWNNLNTYLEGRYSEQTASTYLWSIRHFAEEMGEANLNMLRYKDIMWYIGHLRKQGQTANHISLQLAAIKVLFNFIMKEGDRVDNPARSIVLKDTSEKAVQFQDLFSAAELEKLLQRKERYRDLIYRNRCMIGLLIYHGALSADILQLKVHDVYLDKKEIFCSAKAKTSSRSFYLAPSQLQDFEYYLHYERPVLLSKSRIPTDYLFLSKLGTPVDKDGLHYLLESSRHLFPGRKLDTVTVRQSVIANWFKSGLGLRDIQRKSGTKWTSSLEKYKPVDRDEMLKSVMMFHPMG